MKTEQQFPFLFQAVRVSQSSQIIVIILFLSFLLSCSTMMKVGGQGNRMVGGIMEKMGKEKKGTAVGSLLTKGGQIHTAVGSAAENSADKNKGVGEALKAATTAGKGALNDTNNMSNQKIKKSQELLISKGYAQGKADGIMGGKTVNAIKKYQKDNGLPITGKLDTATCKCMGI